MSKSFDKIKVGVGLLALCTLFAFNLHHAVVYHYGILNPNFSQNWQVYAQTNSVGTGGNSHPGGAMFCSCGATSTGLPCLCGGVIEECETITESDNRSYPGRPHTYVTYTFSQCDPYWYRRRGTCDDGWTRIVIERGRINYWENKGEMWETRRREVVARVLRRILG